MNKDTPEAVFRIFQDAVRKGEVDNAYSFLSESCCEKMGGYTGFQKWFEKRRTVVSQLDIEATKERGTTFYVITDTFDIALMITQMEKDNGKWKITKIDDQSVKCYPPGKEEPFSQAAYEFSRLGKKFFDLKTKVDEIKRIIRYMNSDICGELEAIGELMSDVWMKLLEYHKVFSNNRKAEVLDEERLEKIQRSVESFLNKGHDVITYMESELAIQRKELQDLPDRADETDRAGNNERIDSHLNIGIAGNPYRYEAFPAFAHAGFDFIAMDLHSMGSSRQIKNMRKSGKFDFSRLHSLIEENAKRGYKTDIEQGGFGYLGFCIFDPEERKGWQDLFRALGKEFCDNKDVLAYELFNEPHIAPYRHGAEWGDFEFKEWQNYLKDKFGTVENLNREWDTNYRDFNSIIPPIQPPNDILRPLDYEHCLFRRETMANFLDSCCKALKETDPNHPVMAQMNIDNGQQDAFLVGQKSFDIFSIHMAFGGYHGGENNMVQVYSHGRFLGKPRWQEELPYNNPEARTVDDELELASAINRNVWQAMAWGYCGILFFRLASSWENWSNYLLDLKVNASISRPSATAIGSIIDKAKRIGQPLLNTEIIQADVAIFDSPTGMLSLTAPVPPMQEYFDYMDDFRALEGSLAEEHIGYFYIPEAGLEKRPDELKKYCVVIMPKIAQQILCVAAEILLEWVKEGGVIISINGAGCLDEYGRPSAISSYVRKGEVAVDKGAIINVPEPDREFIEHLTNYLPLQEVSTDCGEDLELVMREDSEGMRYLTGINISTKRKIEFTVSIRGDVEDIVDLGVEGGRRVPIRKDGGYSSFESVLERGGATIWKIF